MGQKLDCKMRGAYWNPGPSQGYKKAPTRLPNLPPVGLSVRPTFTVFLAL